MKRKSDQAGAFIAIATYERSGDGGQHDVREALSLTPDTTIAELFKKVWPAEETSKMFFKPPYKIEILPDSTTIPSEDPDPFFPEAE